MAAPGANFDFGGYDVRALTLTADVATGTAPLNITSETVCPHLNVSFLEGNAASAFAAAAHNQAPATITFANTAKILGRKTASGGAGEECSLSDVLDLVGSAAWGDILYRGETAWVRLGHGTAGQVLSSGGHDAAITWADGGAGGAAFWTDFPGTPTRVGNTSFKVTDASNANLYDLMFSPGTIIKWEKSGGGFQCAKITVAAYAANEVTYTIVGNTLAADFTDMKYCLHRARKEVFIVPGTLPGNTATADISKTVFAEADLLIFSALVRYKTASATTKGVWDINDDATTIFATKPEIAATAVIGTETVCDCVAATATTVVAKDSILTLDYDSGHATTPGSDAYVTIWYMPAAWRYIA
jgi:hypothetical protein